MSQIQNNYNTVKIYHQTSVINMIYRFQPKEGIEIVEERVSEEDRENTNNVSTSFVMATP